MPPSAPTQCTYSYAPPDSVPTDDRVNLSEPVYDGCPHEPIDPDGERCLFHAGKTEYPTERFTEQFQQILAEGTVHPTFAGGNLETLDLAGETITTASKEPLDLRGVIIDGDLKLTDAIVEIPLLLDGAAITGSVYAEDADFRAPISFAGADISGRMYCRGATVSGGLLGTDLNAGYIDARRLTVEGALVLDGASFASNLHLARASVTADVVLTGATFDWSLDATNLTVKGDFLADDVSIDADCECVAAEIDGAVELRKLTVGDETDWSHATVADGLTATDAEFGDAVNFEDVSVSGEAVSFDGARFPATTDFGMLTVPDGYVSFTEAAFEDEVWFTHAEIGGQADFGRASFTGMSHLRDATFEDNLRLRAVEATGQFFLHGSIIKGDCDCADASFEHFQFSATVQGKADFSDAEFIEKALFQSSTFGDRVWFDGASFAGHPDFSDTRFTGKTIFDGTEFLVDPTFENTRFAVDPDLTAANFPLAEDIDFSDRREQMILVHPDALHHEGATIPVDTVSGDLSVPAAAAHLVEDDLDMTRGIAKSLSEIDARDWHATVEDALRTARTAVARLPGTSEVILVFGLSVNTDQTPGAEWIESIMLAGAYCQNEAEIVFGHLDPSFYEADYLVPIPAADEAFESGATVATSSELHEAALRHEMFRAAMLGKQQDDTQPINNLLVPVLVGAETLGNT